MNCTNSKIEWKTKSIQCVCRWWSYFGGSWEEKILLKAGMLYLKRNTSISPFFTGRCFKWERFLEESLSFGLFPCMSCMHHAFVHTVCRGVPSCKRHKPVLSLNKEKWLSEEKTLFSGEYSKGEGKALADWQWWWWELLRVWVWFIHSLFLFVVSFACVENLRYEQTVTEMNNRMSENKDGVQVSLPLS